MDIRVPAKIGIIRVVVNRDRAEVTDITIGYYGHGVPIVDGSITPDQRDGNRYDIKHPNEFKAQRTPFNIWISGTWRWGGTPGQGMAKMDVTYFSDRIVAAFFTGLSEPSNTRVEFLIEPHLDRSLVPELAD